VPRKERGVAVMVRGEARNGTGLLIAGVRRFIDRYFELKEL
jgi:hypothetical protein